MVIDMKNGEINKFQNNKKINKKKKYLDKNKKKTIDFIKFYNLN